MTSSPPLMSHTIASSTGPSVANGWGAPGPSAGWSNTSFTAPGPAVPCGPRSPVSPLSPLGPGVSWPAAKSWESNEPSLTLLESTAFRARSAFLTWPFVMCVERTLFLDSFTAATALPPSRMNRHSVETTLAYVRRLLTRESVEPI
jgi:hypothetical protein